MDMLELLGNSVSSAFWNRVVGKALDYVNIRFSRKTTRWKDWTWSIDDDEENCEMLGPLESIPFADIEKLQPHWRFINDLRITKRDELTTYLWNDDTDFDKRRYYVRMGTVDDYIGNGSPDGNLCYCLYERKDGKNHIKRFFSRGKNRVELERMGLLRYY